MRDTDITFLLCMLAEQLCESGGHCGSSAYRINMLAKKTSK